MYWFETKTFKSLSLSHTSAIYSILSVLPANWISYPFNNIMILYYINRYRPNVKCRSLMHAIHSGLVPPSSNFTFAYVDKVVISTHHLPAYVSECFSGSPLKHPLPSVFLSTVYMACTLPVWQLRYVNHIRCSQDLFLNQSRRELPDIALFIALWVTCRVSTVLSVSRNLLRHCSYI